MKKIVALVVMLLVVVGVGFGKKIFLSDEQVELSTNRAVKGVMSLRSMDSVDPSSFVLTNVALKAPDKRGIIEVCYTFREGTLTNTARLNSKGEIDHIQVVTDFGPNQLLMDILDSDNPCSLGYQARTLSIFPEVKKRIKSLAQISESKLGTIKFVGANYDSEVSVSADGNSSFIGCNISGSSASCSDYSGSTIITLQSGTWFFDGKYGVNEEAANEYSVCETQEVCDPLNSLRTRLIGLEKIQFRYHMVVEPWDFRNYGGVAKHGVPTAYWCVEFSITDKTGKEKPQSRCYRLDYNLLFNADGTSYFKSAPDLYHMKK